MNSWTGNALLIAEKPELGRAVASALVGNYKETNGVIVAKEIGLTIVWAYGHLLTLAEPEQIDNKYLDRKKEDLLPIAFDNWKRVPPDDVKNNGKIKTDNAYRRKRLEQIGRLLKQYDTVIHCGDPDDEGQLLIDEILEYFNYDGQVLRVLINDNLPENIRRQFANLQNNEKYQNIGRAAYAREMADMCFGINYSRLASCRTGKFLPIGRVLTPTLNLVVVRDAQIEAHVTQKYYEMVADIQVDGKTLHFKFMPNKEMLDGENHLFEREPLDLMAKKLQGYTFQKIKFENSIKLESPPLPYNATELQADMNGKFGYSLSETVKITQSLRDKYKAITYNRSDCQYLMMEHYENAPDLFPTVFNNLGKKFPIDYTIRSKCFDDSKISAHHGIIPQKTELDLSRMTEKERNVYTAICERYIMQFLPAIKKECCKTSIPGKTGTFSYSSFRIVDKGYQQYFRSTGESENEHWFIPEGVYSGTVENVRIEEKETKPLARYTPKTLVKDMCGISKYVKDPAIKEALKNKDKGKEGENGSIGTVATRGVIVDNLLKYGYLETKGKSLVSTPKGRELCRVIPEHAKMPDSTAKWWLIQEDIKDGNQSVNEIMHQVAEAFTQDMSSAFQQSNFDSISEQRVYGKCPVCEANVLKGVSSKNKKAIWYCSKYKEGCDFRIYENMKYFENSIHMTDSKVEKLIDGGTIIAQLASKAGKEYRAKMELEINENHGKHYSNLKFVDYVNSKK